MSTVNSYKDLIVWKRSFELSLLIYKLTNKFPDQEKYALTSQIRRSAISIPSNIAEGNTRSGIREYVKFLYIAFSSGAELETQLLIAKELAYLSESDYIKVDKLLTGIMKMLNVLISKIKSST